MRLPDAPIYSLEYIYVDVLILTKYVVIVQGEIASAFGDLLKKLWAPGASPVAPRAFKSKLSHFAPQFSGFNQHDSQVCSLR